MGVQDIEKIEGKIDRAVAGAVPVDMQLGGIQISTMMEVFEMAKLMAISEKAVPKHLRGSPGTCLAICIQALEWHMSPFSVANKSYEVNDRIAYEAQLIVAVINARAPLQERLRYAYEGEGVEMFCTVSGLVKGEATPLIYKSPKIRDIKVKNSPLWTADPQQQLGYYSGRAWCRRHTPETILGIYAVDEVENSDPIGSSTTTVKPSVGERLRGQRNRGGFHEEGVTRALAHKPAEALETGAKPKPDPVIIEQPKAEPVTELALGEDVPNEIASKKRAVDNVDTADDLRQIVAATTEYLKSVKRTDLLADFLSHAAAREKKLKA